MTNPTDKTASIHETDTSELNQLKSLSHQNKAEQDLENSIKMQRLADIKREQARIAAQEAEEMDRIAQQQRQSIQEKNDKMAYLLEVKKEQARIIAEEAKEMNRLAEQQRKVIMKHKANNKEQTPEQKEEYEREEEQGAELYRVYLAKQEQARIADEEAKEMDRLAQEQRTALQEKRQKLERLEQIRIEQTSIEQAENEEMDRIAKKQRLEMEQRLLETELRVKEREYANRIENAVYHQRINEYYSGHNHEYDGNIFTMDQIEKFLKTYSGIFVGLLISSSLWMHVFNGMSLLMTSAAVMNGLCVLMVLNRKIINYVWGTIAVILYGYMAWLDNHAINTDVLISGFYLIMQPIGFHFWYKDIKLKQKYHPEFASVNQFEIPIHVRRLPETYIKYVIALFVVIAGAWYGILSGGAIYGSHSGDIIVSHMDVLVNTTAVIGQILMTLRYREQWWAWLLTNVGQMYLWGNSMSPMGMFQWSLLFLNSCVALYIWSKESNIDKIDEDAQNEEERIRRLQEQARAEDAL